jgi:hypothetical protein
MAEGGPTSGPAWRLSHLVGVLKVRDRLRRAGGVLGHHPAVRREAEADAALAHGHARVEAGAADVEVVASRRGRRPVLLRGGDRPLHLAAGRGVMQTPLSILHMETIL